MKYRTANWVLYTDESTPEERGVRGVANVHRLIVDDDVRGCFAGLRFDGALPSTRIECSVQGLDVWSEVLAPEVFEALDFLSVDESRRIRMDPGAVVEVVVWGPCEKVIVVVLKDAEPEPAKPKVRS